MKFKIDLNVIINKNIQNIDSPNLYLWDNSITAQIINLNYFDSDISEKIESNIGTVNHIHTSNVFFKALSYALTLIKRDKLFSVLNIRHNISFLRILSKWVMYNSEPADLSLNVKCNKYFYNEYKDVFKNNNYTSTSTDGFDKNYH